MPRSQRIVFNSCFAINCLLLFVLLFASRLVIPSWLQVLGRMHPLVLHIPITLLLLYIAWIILIEKRLENNETLKLLGDWLLLITAFTAAATALMGMFLSLEDGYDPSSLQLHKWSGIAVSLITIIWFAYQEKIKKVKWLNSSTALLSLVVIVITGHQGAEISHGENFLLAPVMKDNKGKQVLMENALVFEHMVKPILESKCMGCHNTSKAKGQLIMETEALLLKGGKNGKLWDSTAANYGLLLSRIHMPLESKKHMPPSGKPQLSEQELQVLYAWIKSGASFNTKVLDLDAEDTIRVIANTLFNTVETDDYDFSPADEATIKKLNNNYRVVSALAKESPALGITFYGASFYTPAQLTELLPVKDQVVSLNLNKMPVKDDELKTISQFSRLRKLNLSFTSITGTTLQELNKLKELRQLSLTGTKINKEAIQTLSSLNKLSRIYLWSTTLSEKDIADLQHSMKEISFEKGFLDTGMIKLTPPILVNDERIVNKPLTLQLKHYIKGVSMRYTLDGTEPDSASSPLFKNSILIDSNATLKTKAFKPGWLSSSTTETVFYSSKQKPDSVIHIELPEDPYKGDGPKTLNDLVKGDMYNYRTSKWLGYRKNKMESLLMYTSAVTIKTVGLSTVVDIGGFIMPPFSVEAWGGENKDHLKLLGRIKPAQPDTIQPAYFKTYELNFKPVSVKYIKIIAVPVPVLPKWHPGKKQKGWIFTDEVMVN